jgi:hypothetical protein
MVRWDEITKKLQGVTAPIGLELGVFIGRNAAHLLKLNPSLFLFLVDSYVLTEDRLKWADGDLGATQEQMDGYKIHAESRLAKYKHRTKFIYADYKQAAKEIPDSSLHFVFIDSDHSYEGTYEQCVLYWDKIKSGGFLSGHDYDHPIERWGVKKAVDQFAEERKLAISLGDDFTWFIHRSSTS